MGSTFFPYLAALMWIGILLLAGTLLRAKIKILQTFLVPSALIAGILGFILVSTGLLGMPTADGWVEIPTKTFSYITFHLFAFGFVGVGLLRSETSSTKTMAQGGLWMALLFGLIWAIQGILGKTIFELWAMITGSSISSDLGYLLGSGFAQGPGQVHAYGTIWENTYQITHAVNTGLAFAAMGFMVAVLIGVPLANVGIKRGWITEKNQGSLPDFFLRGIMNKGNNPPCSLSTTHPANIDNLAFHVSIMAAIYAIAYCFGLAWSLNMPQGFNGLGFGLLFTWGMFFAIVIRMIMTKVNLIYLVDPGTIRRITNTSVDYMICAVFMAISFSDLKAVIIPFFSAVGAAAFASLIVIMWFARRAPEYAFERGLAIFGCYTGTVASGLLLLRIIDPEFKSPAAVELGIMNVIILVTCAPLLYGYPFVPAEGFSMFAIMLAYLIITPIAMYVLKFIRKPNW